MKTIFFGTPELAAKILEGILEKIKIDLIVTQPAKPFGRNQILKNSAVKNFCLKRDLLFKEASRFDAEMIEFIKQFKPDLILVAAYGVIFPLEVLMLPKFGCINVHFSILPKYRGACPMQAALLAGERISGITLMLMDQGLDTGKIIHQEQVTISSEDKYPELELKLINKSIEIIPKILTDWTANKIQAKNQDEVGISLTKLIKKQDGQIFWQKQTASEIYNQFRAFYVWPKIFSSWRNKKIIFEEIEPVEKGELFNSLEKQINSLVSKKTNEAKNSNYLELKSESGLVFCLQSETGKVSGVFIAAKEGFIEIKKIKMEGKNVLSAKDFLNGQRDFSESVLE